MLHSERELSIIVRLRLKTLRILVYLKHIHESSAILIEFIK